MSKTEDWQRLGEEVGMRMAELDLKQSDIQARGGPSPAKVREIVNGRASTLSSSKRRDLERALDWGPRSIEDVLAGGYPREISAAGQATNLTAAEEAVSEAEARLNTEESVVGQSWATVIDLVKSVLKAGPDPELRSNTQRIVFMVSGFLIIRILRSGFAPELEKWLERIYIEREALYRQLVPAGQEPKFPWATNVFENEAEAASYAVRHFGLVDDAELSVSGEVDDVADVTFDSAIKASLTDAPEDEEDSSGLGDVPGAAGNRR